MRRIPPLPATPGAYRWLYADAQCGPYSVVCIMMVGALFSPRYAVAARRGARPLAHCAVSCAVHHRGRRLAWVFTERPGAAVEDDGRTLRIGPSRLSYGPDGAVRIAVDERTAPWGRRLRLALRLVPAAPPGPELSVDGGGPHRWQPLVPRARAELVLEGGTPVAGIGYHDGNHGPERLGLGLRGWRWSRVHAPDATWIRYCPPAPSTTIEVVARADGVDVQRTPPALEAMRRSRWGLPLPATIAAGEHAVPVTAVLESSPFYARQEGRRGDLLALAEVADFQRFHSPLIRWMAHFRLRVERAA